VRVVVIIYLLTTGEDNNIHFPEKKKQHIFSSYNMVVDNIVKTIVKFDTTPNHHPFIQIRRKKKKKSNGPDNSTWAPTSRKSKGRISNSELNSNSIPKSPGFAGSSFL